MPINEYRPADTNNFATWPSYPRPGEPGALPTSTVQLTAEQLEEIAQAFQQAANEMRKQAEEAKQRPALPVSAAVPDAAA